MGNKNIKRMKKYFLFDDEPITGWNYIWRIFVGTMLSFLLVGLWISASAAYKRTGAFNWPKEYRIVISIGIPVLTILNVLGNEIDDFGNFFNWFGLIFTIIHMVLFYKNGNKKKNQKKDDLFNDEINPEDLLNK